MKIEDIKNIYRLKDVIRYNTRKHIQSESVAEHSYYVALFSMLICDEYHLSDEIKFLALQKAILHDAPEIELNDITYNVKERLNLRPMLKEYEDEFYEKNYPFYAKMMKDDSDSLENLVWRFADTLSVLQFCINEKDIGNNDVCINEIYLNSIERINDMQEKMQKKLKCNYLLLDTNIL